jgi:hypothetical protein
MSMDEEGMIMGKVSVGIVLLAFVTALTVTLGAPALASLMPTQFGFPVIMQSGQAFSFSSDLASSTDIESLNIDFPAFDGLMSSSGMPATGIWQMQGLAAPDLGLTDKLFDLSAFKFR